MRAPGNLCFNFVALLLPAPPVVVCTRTCATQTSPPTLVCATQEGDQALYTVTNAGRYNNCD